MKLWAFARSKRALQCVSVAVMLSLAAGVSIPSLSRADDENGLFTMLRKKNGTTGTTSSSTTSHTVSSGVQATTETKVLNDGSQAAFITTDSAAQIQALADKYAKIVADGGWPQVPRGRAKKGTTGKQVEILNKRLYIEGYLQVEATQGEFQSLFTSATEDALKRFQTNHGLSPTGVIDGPTLQALNVPAQQRLATIKANVPRLAEYSRDLGPRYVVVNVPAQQIETVNDGKVYSLHNAIVGRPSRPTPVVMTPLTIVRFNPYWNAPPSIIERDIIPRMQSKGASKVLNDMNIKVFQGVGGPEVNPDKINWRTAKITDYHFRQEPGGDNAMATAKVEFNSPFGIYLHDTPEPQLFKTGNRFYSSGCVRVEKVAILLNWILQGQDGLDEAKIAQLADTKERLDVNIANAPQLRVAYLTAWPANGNVAAFRQDIYELDGTGFVVGQPLPVGETQNGQRFVLKPIPYLQDDIDTDNGGFFGALFGKNSENVPRTNKPATVTTATSKQQPGAKTVKTATKAAKTTKGSTASRGFLDGSGKDRIANAAPAQPAPDPKAKKKLKKPAAKSTSTKSTATASTAKTPAKPGAKPADTKSATAAKTPATSGAKAATATTTAPAAKSTAAVTPAKPAATTAAAKPAATTAAKPAAASCKPGSDGKLPAGCPAAPAAAPAAAKKPAAAAAATTTPAAKTANAAN